MLNILKWITARGRLHNAMAVMLLFAYSAVAGADLILTSAPRESLADGQKQYGPLAEELSQILGEKVTYRQPKGWLYYQRDMRADEYDIVFDGPHFISWRINQFAHTPVAKLPGKLGFIVVTSKDNKDIEVLDDLINTSVCAIAPPNLATLTVLAQYENPVRQPRLVTPKGGFEGVYKSLSSGECAAAVLRDAFYEKNISDEEKATLKILFTSKPIANQGITVSSRVSAEQREKITAALTTAGSPGIAPTLKRFAGKADKMLPADVSDYAGHYRLLTGVIFGWEITNKDFVSEDASR